MNTDREKLIEPVRATDPVRLSARWEGISPIVIVLNGPAGVGKTTTARALAAMADNGACIHGDQLRDFVVARKAGTVQQGLGYRNGATVAGNFVAAGYELVVFEYVFEKPGAIDHFTSAYCGQAPVFFFTLWAPLTAVCDRERGRLGREPLGQRVEACWREIDRHLEGLGHVIDTESLSVAEVVAEIARRCRDRRGLLIGDALAADREPPVATTDRDARNRLIVEVGSSVRRVWPELRAQWKRGLAWPDATLTDAIARAVDSYASAPPPEGEKP